MVGKRRGFVRIVSRIYLPEAAAASFRLAGVAKALREKGVEVEVVTTTPPRGLQASDQDRVRRFPVLRDKEGYVRGYLQYLSFDIPAFFRVLFSPRAAVTLVEPPPTTGFFVRIASKFLGVPYVYYAADLWSEAVKEIFPSSVYVAVRMLEKFAIRGAKTVIAVNSVVAAQVREMGAKSVVVVTQGADTESFSREGHLPTAKMRAEIGVYDSPYFIYPGNASEWHGADIFIKALKQLSAVRDVHLVYLGRGGQWQMLRKMAERYGVDKRVHFSDTVPPNIASQWIRGSKCSLASIKPGSGYEFAYTTKVLSSFSCGVPVIYAGPGPAGKDIAANQLGICADYSAASVARAMETIINEDAPVRNSNGLREWVVKNKSLSASSDKVAEALLRIFHY